MATVHAPHPAKKAAQPIYGYPQQNHQNGLLQPGKIININSYTVTVERYLSQGGFAHVYVVQSQTPINGTLQHVLKRIAVPNEAALREVKKEVDVMKVLRGHPNIVNLIDATSNPTGNGTFEVFILMEFCPGGGIIDMMNRRLRERLTEAEILQIFVDVCEGVACMHYLKPPLIHRDLKVENILQASLTNFKLCDFGSAVAVPPRAPSATADLRALEADINRHTTFQYRAPEMVDVYLRRPVDEKSDVWALGVLLYKLCYYTTPFEEHGQLAIINVTYRIPPYPVYSNNMNTLIASMLREHGAQRPTVFDLLEHVHRLRGTKPLFSYNRPQQSALPLRSTTILSNDRPKTYSPTAARAAETQKQVFDAIQPMRRGRPSVGTALVPSPAPLSPIKSGPSKITGPPMKFPKPGEFNSVALKSQYAVDSNAWRVGIASPANRSVTNSSVKEPNSDAIEPSEDSFRASTVRIASASIPRYQTSPKPPSLPNRNRPPPPARQHHRTGPVVSMTPKRDAFEGLDPTFASKPPPKTLGSLSISTSIDNTVGPGLRSPSAPYLSTKTSGATGGSFLNPGTANKVSRPPSSSPSGDLPAEERFPSLEGLDQHFAKAVFASPRFLGTDTSAKPIQTGLAPPALGSANRTSPLPDRFQDVVRPIGSGSGSGARNVTSRPPSPSGPRTRSPHASPETRPKGLPPPSSYGTQQVGSRFTTASFSPLSTQRSSEKLSGHGVRPSMDSGTKTSLSKLDVNQSPSTLPSRPGVNRAPSTPVIVAQTRDLLEEIFASDVSSPPPLLTSSTKHLVPPSTVTSSRSRPLSSVAGKRAPSPHVRGENLRPLGRRNSSRSGESSGGDDAPEDAAPRRISRLWNVPQRTSPLQSPIVQPSTLNGVSEPKSGGDGRTHARKTSAYDLVDVPPPSSVPVVASTGNQRSPSRQGRRPASVYDLVDVERPLVSPTIQPTGIQRQRTPQTTGNPASPQDGQFIANRVSPNAYPSPRPSPVLDPPNGKIQGGPRPRPQSMFLTSSNFLIPPGAPSEALSPNESGAPPKHRRLSISDIVSKFEEVARGASVSSDVPRQGRVSRTPSGAFSFGTPKLSSTGTSLSTSPSKPPITQPSSQYKSQRSPVSISSPSLSATQMTDVISSNPPVTKRHIKSLVHSTTPDNGPFTPNEFTREPSPAEVQQPPLSPQRADVKKLNVVPPPDFMGRQDQPPPSPIRTGVALPATHSPAPERPYQGVSKLIDQWQKKTEAATGESNVVARKPLGPGRAFR